MYSSDTEGSNYYNMTMREVNGTMIDTSIISNAVQKKNSIIEKEDLISEEDEITLEDLAPDGGWGWMIALAMILIMVSLIIMHNRYLVMFNTH